MLKIGRVEEIDNTTQRARVKFESDEGMISYWLAVLSRKTLKDQVYCMPDKGELVACLMDANCEEGVVLGAIYSEADPTPISDDDTAYLAFEDGTKISYDRKNHVLTGRVEGEVNLSVKDNATISSDATLILSAAEALVLQAPMILIGGENETGAAATLRANLDMIGNLTVEGNASVTENVSAGANLAAGQNVTAGGRITDTTGNTNHHAH
ncbi:MAG: phage baseplate assembly protein V [Desulfovibrionaceae bacterium]|nr:phage baseplate assembly protein V [Desulfovibrionaceae bacterium]MBF0513620.1 phage baseplate assembly protein V [Desulfovibrionaceae bacterium]